MPLFSWQTPNSLGLYHMSGAGHFAALAVL